MPLNWTCILSHVAAAADDAASAKSLQSCPTLCDPIDSSPPGSPIPGILQERTLEWVAIPVFLPEKSHGQRSLAGYSPWGRKELDTTEHLAPSGHLLGL